MNKIHKATFFLSLPLNAFLVYLYWSYAPIVLAQDEPEAEIRLFEDYSGEIVNGNKHFGFMWLPSEGNETLVFEDDKILFSNGTVLANE